MHKQALTTLEVMFTKKSKNRERLSYKEFDEEYSGGGEFSPIHSQGEGKQV